MSTPQQQRVTKLLSALFDYDQKHISTFSGAVRRANELRYPASLDREMNLSNIRFILDKREPLLAAIPQASEEMLSYMEKDLLSTLQYIGYTNTNQSDNPLEYIDPDGRENGMPSDVETRLTIHSEIERAFQLADSGAVYDDNADLAGTVVPMGLDQYDCSSELSAVTQLPLLSTAELADPDIRGQYYDDVPEGQAQAGDWLLVRYTVPGTETQRGHVQMIIGENAYADSIPATGPRITTNNPVDAYLQNNNIVPDLIVIIRPRRNQ